MIVDMEDVETVVDLRHLNGGRKAFMMFFGKNAQNTFKRVLAKLWMIGDIKRYHTWLLQFQFLT